ncbi:hypothetical protein [Laribacter hongkongensis]|uniref:hypothetical protein n=1 Tax=Laribacter hongkongensis TaxID=168471 RepID=UPI001EFC8AB5|nr:hypothetical protein [Laribacter hongkongensis]MCG9093551.1 hypothetical protein [Laribacter hongkongensis]
MTEYVELPGLGPRCDSWSFESLPGFPSGFALAGAELAYAMLKDPADSENNLAWLSIIQILYSLRDFSEFAASMGCYRFSDVSQELLSQYLNVLMYGNEEREAKSNDRIKTLISMLYKVWVYSPRLSEPLPEQPFERSKEEMLSNIPRNGNSNENKTPPIPEYIYAPLMAASLGYVLDHSVTILEAWTELQVKWNTEIKNKNIGPNGKEKRLTKAAAIILKKHLSPWRRRAWKGRSDLYVELYRLRIACILVILAYSGVRASELFSIEENCYVVDETLDGKPINYLNTVLRKHRHKGSKDTWVIIEDVIKAIDVLEQITKHARTALRTKRLLLSGNGNQFFNVQSLEDANSFVELSSSTLLEGIEQFRQHVNENLNFPPIPLWTDQYGVERPWKFNTRQFRRTLARYIARQPFGVIAGMRQYKHVQVAIFEGYAGVDTEWLDMVGEERGLAQFDFIDEIVISLSSGAVAGEAGIQIKQAFEAEFKGRAEDFSPSTIAKWLASTNKTLFVGNLNLCYFEPTKARCLRNSDIKDTPILNRCEPENCKNACVTKRHLPLWTAQLKQVEDAICHPKVSVIAKQLLSKEASKIRKIVEDVQGETE